MPLIEPLETKEVKKIEEFAVVIDTSMSCSEELVRRFLEQTYTVLSEAESFFTKMNIHVIQCDEKIQSDHIISSAEELADYMEHFELIGQSATDFRPVFAHVNKLREEGAFRHLKGILYFTDVWAFIPPNARPTTRCL